MTSEEEFKFAKPKRDEDGNILILGETVMFADEEGFIKKSIREIHEITNFKSVVEIGFGLGFTADEIESFNPELHIIIESNDELYKEAVKWADNRQNIRVINSRWQDVTTEIVDLIYYDAHEMMTIEDMVSDGESKDWSNIPSVWYSELCTPQIIDREDFFVFEHEGQFYSQKLIKRGC